MVHNTLTRPQTFVIAAGSDRQVFTVIQVIYEDLVRIGLSQCFQAGSHLMEMESIQRNAYIGKTHFLHHIVCCLELIDRACRPPQNSKDTRISGPIFSAM